MVDTNFHNCYIRSCKPQEHKPILCFMILNAMFYFECYLPTSVPKCSLCKDLKRTCTKCSVCKTCQRVECGNKTNAPNLVVATTVCEMCIDDITFLKESKGEHCGTRCNHCNKFDMKENCYKRTPCPDTCGFREIVFSGENTAHDFGKWLFSQNHKYFTAIAHNAKGYDNYFILEYLIDNSIRPEIIYNGSKIMYMLVKKGSQHKVFRLLKLFANETGQVA